MLDKQINIISIIVSITLFVLAIIFKGLPEYKESLGSSDSLIISSNYEDMIEFKIQDSANFSIITKDNKVKHILIFNKQAVILYNKNIENKSFDEAIEKIINILINSNSISNYSNIELTKYKSINYKKIKNVLEKYLVSNNLSNTKIVEKTTTLEEKAKLLGLRVKNKKTIIFQLGIYSKEIIDKYKNETNTSLEEISSLTEEKSLEYANNVFQKLENYVITNNIVEQDINSSVLPIILIPANKEANFYPSTKSWYYVTNNKIYAYIAFDDKKTTYAYCYQGSINEVKKGEC